MDIIIFIILGIVILYRMYKVLQEIRKIVKDPKFKRGVLIVIIYIFTLFNIMGFIGALAELAYALDSKILYILSFILVVTTIVGAILIIKFLFKEYEEVKLPFKLMLLIITLGLLIFSAYNLVDSKNKSNDKEFINPHEVDGYTREDGVEVRGYWRDGDGNPDTILTKETGGGYWRSK